MDFRAQPDLWTYRVIECIIPNEEPLGRYLHLLMHQIHWESFELKWMNYGSPFTISRHHHLHAGNKINRFLKVITVFRKSLLISTIKLLCMINPTRWNCNKRIGIRWIRKWSLKSLGSLLVSICCWARMWMPSQWNTSCTEWLLWWRNRTGFPCCSSGECTGKRASQRKLRQISMQPTRQSKWPTVDVKFMNALVTVNSISSDNPFSINRATLYHSSWYVVNKSKRSMAKEQTCSNSAADLLCAAFTRSMHWLNARLMHRPQIVSCITPEWNRIVVVVIAMFGTKYAIL